MARPKLRLDLSTAEDKENQSVVKDLKRRPSTDVVAARELQAFQNQVAKLWSTKEQDETSSRGSITSLLDLSNKPLAATTEPGADTSNDISKAVSADIQTSSSSSDATSQPSALLAHSSADSQIAAGGTRSAGNDPKTQICFDFTKGVCTRGSSCKFSHDVALIVSVNSQERGICFDFLRGQCHRGLLCRFSHDLSSLAAQQCQRGSRRNAPICYDFVKGVCARGPDCRYSHDINSIINDTRHTSHGNNAAQLCHDYSKGRCARGSACRYSHDFSALTAASPLMPALTAAAAAAAIAQISLHPGGLLPQLAPYLQPYAPSAPQHATLQQQLLQDRGQSPSLPSQTFPFAKAAFPQATVTRDSGRVQTHSFSMSAAASAPTFSYSGMNANAAPYTGRHANTAPFIGASLNASPYAGMNVNAPGFQPASQDLHTSVMPQRVQGHHASKHMYGLGQENPRQSSPSILAPQRSLPELYGGIGSGGRSLSSHPNNLPNFGGRPVQSSPGPVPSPAYSPFQSMQREPASIARHGSLPDKRYISKPEVEQPMKPSVLASTTGAQMNALPTATKAIPVPPASCPRLVHAQPSHSLPPSAAQSLPSVHSHTDGQVSDPVASGTLSANAPEFKSIQELCFDAASLGISESGSRVSVVEYDGDCNSSTSEHSSGPPLEAPDSGLLSAGSGHLFMCQEIWKR